MTEGQQLIAAVKELEGMRTTAKSQARKIAAIFSLCQRHNHPGVNVGSHALASEVLAIIERGSE